MVRLRSGFGQERCFPVSSPFWSLCTRSRRKVELGERRLEPAGACSCWVRDLGTESRVGTKSRSGTLQLVESRVDLLLVETIASSVKCSSMKHQFAINLEEETKNDVELTK